MAYMYTEVMSKCGLFENEDNFEWVRRPRQSEFRHLLRHRIDDVRTLNHRPHELPIDTS